MRKLRNLIGLPVIMNGKKIGRLIQAELSEDLRDLRAIWMDAGFKGTRRIPVENLEMIGQKAVMADSKGSRSRCKSDFPIYRAVSTDGQRLGAITGAEIDEITFAVQALELSGGLWDDLYSGRSRILRYTANLQSMDVIIQDSADETSKEGKT